MLLVGDQSHCVAILYIWGALHLVQRVGLELWTCDRPTNDVLCVRAIPETSIAIRGLVQGENFLSFVTGQL